MIAWLEWLEITAILIALGAIIVAALGGLFWLLTAPLGSGPERIVDVENRGRTRIRMPDGTIK